MFYVWDKRMIVYILYPMMRMAQPVVSLTRDATSCSSGTTAVYTRFPFTTRRISMESVVKARM